MVILKFEIFLAMKVPMVTTESGLQYKEIKVGQGPSPPIGFQVSKLIPFWKLVLLPSFTENIYEWIATNGILKFSHM